MQRVSTINYYSFEGSMIHQWPPLQHMSVFLLSLLEDNDIYIRITPLEFLIKYSYEMLPNSFL